MSELNTEFAWLIEKAFVQDDGNPGMGPLYYAVGDVYGSESYWTTDAFKALRFARQKDASDFINAFKIVNASAIEHGWDTRWHSQS